MKTKETMTPAVKQERRAFKWAGTHTGLGALVYLAVMGAIGSIASVIVMFQGLLGMSPEQLRQLSVTDLMNLAMNDPIIGLATLLGCVFGALAVSLLFIRGGTHKELFKKGKKMTVLKFLGLMSVLYLFATIGSEIYNIFERELNFFGLSTAVGLEMASGTTTSVVMALAMGIVGPIAEELVFRGFLLRRLEKKGKVLAILVTSLLFGLVHGNLPQVFFATMIGLVLSYIAMEYSIIWSIVLHIFNNLILCEVAGLVFGEGTVRHVFDLSFTVITAVVGIAVLVKNAKPIVAWIRNNMCKKSELVWTLTGWGMIVSIAYMVIQTIATLLMIG